MRSFTTAVCFRTSWTTCALNCAYFSSDSLPTAPEMMSGVRASSIRIESTSSMRSEEHTSELHHTVISYAVFCLKKKKEQMTDSTTASNKFLLTSNSSSV